MNKEKNHKNNGFSPQGSLLVSDFWGCHYQFLNSPEFLLKHSIVAAKMAGMSVMTHVIVPFNPQGLSLVLILSESHLAIHTTPEYGFAGIDIFTCGRGNPEIACEYLIETLKPKHVNSKKIARGIIQSDAEIFSGDGKEVEFYVGR